jgi:hypothetical protein
MTFDSIRTPIARLVERERVADLFRWRGKKSGPFARRAPHRDLLPPRARLRLA